MEDACVAGRWNRVAGTTAWIVICGLLFLAASAAAAPRKTSFVHAVGFSFDYPSKWTVKRLDVGLMLAPHDVDVDAGGRPLEVIVVGFLDAGVTDPFDPSFAGAFERHYRSLVPGLSRAGDMDWLPTSMGMGLLIPFEDERGNPHRVYGAVHGELGLFLAHVARADAVRPRVARVREIFASFGWTDSAIDPALVRAWTGAPREAADRESDQWEFASDGRLRRAVGEPRGVQAPQGGRGGFYSTSGGVLNILWDHGLEESYLYTVSKRPEGGPQLELRSPAGEALRLH